MTQPTILIRKTISIVSAKTQENLKFRNHYRCPHDQTKWIDDWNHICNDRCPNCDRETEPYLSEDIVVASWSFGSPPGPDR